MVNVQNTTTNFLYNDFIAVNSKVPQFYFTSGYSSNFGTWAETTVTTVNICKEIESVIKID